MRYRSFYSHENVKKVFGSQYQEISEDLRLKLQNKSVAICIPDNLSAALTIAQLDGVVKTLVLVPPDLRAEFTPASDYAFSVDYVIDSFRNERQLSTDEIYTQKSEGPVDTTYYLFTSGTSGKPKVIQHTRAFLLNGVAQCKAEDAPQIWGMMYRTERFAGLQVLLHCLSNSLRLVFPTDERDFSNVVSLFQSHKVNSVSATPTTWRMLLMVPGSERIPLMQVTLGGEIVDQGVLTLLSNTYLNAKITHIYASTEGGVGFSVSDKRAGFPLSYIGRTFRNVLLSHDSNTETLHVRHLNRGSESMDTGDRVQIVGDRVFFLGRSSGTINVGGNKVHPEEIETLIYELPQVLFVKAYGIKSSLMGHVVGISVVAKDRIQQDEGGLETLRRTILEHCRAKLPRFKIPTSIVFTKDVEVTNAGKLSRER